MGDIVKDLEWRYAVKKFDANLVLDNTKLERIKKAFNLTATSYGLQPLRLLIISDKSVQKKLVPLSFGQQQVFQASHLLVFCVEQHIDANYIKSYFQKVKQTRGTEEAILKPYEEAMIKEFSGKDATDIHIWATKQAYLAMGNLLTVCAIEQIDACPMEGFDRAGYDALLSLEEKGLKSVLAMPIGYRAEDDIFSSFKKVRRDLNETIIEWK